MKFDKAPKTADEQIDLLRSRGMVIDHVDAARHYLLHLNYYRLTGYWLLFEETHEPHRFRQGRYAYDPTRLKEVHVKCFDMAEDALKDGKSVVVSNTFVRMWEIKPYLSLATRYGAQVEVVALNGGFESIHGVPKDVINRMIQSWEDLDI